MAITTGGGITFDREAARNQATAQQQALMLDAFQKAASQMGQDRRDALTAGNDMFDKLIKSNPNFIENPTGFLGSPQGEKAMQAVTRQFSIATGRQLSGTEAFDIGHQLSQFAAKNRTVNDLNNEALTGVMNDKINQDYAAQVAAATGGSGLMVDASKEQAARGSSLAPIPATAAGPWSEIAPTLGGAGAGGYGAGLVDMLQALRAGEPGPRPIDPNSPSFGPFLAPPSLPTDPFFNWKGAQGVDAPHGARGMVVQPNGNPDGVVVKVAENRPEAVVPLTSPEVAQQALGALAQARQELPAGGAGPGSLQASADPLPMVDANPTQTADPAMVKALNQAALETRGYSMQQTLFKAASDVLATSSKVGSKIASVSKTFGSGISKVVEDIQMHLGGEPSSTYKDRVNSQRDAMMIGKYTQEAFRALPAEHRQEILRRLDAVMQSVSPEFMASGGGTSAQTISERRSESASRKVQTYAASMSSSSKTIADLLGPITQAMGQRTSMQQFAQNAAKSEGMSLAKWYEKNDGFRTQENALSSLIDRFSAAVGIMVNTQLETGKKGFWNSEALVSGKQPGDANIAPASGQTALDATQRDIINKAISPKP